MRTFILAAAAASFAVPAMTPAMAQSDHDHHYYEHHSREYYDHHHGRCRHSSGTTGLVAGGVGGALVGNSILGHGALGTIAGGVGGAFAGRAIDRTITADKRCR